MEITGSIYRILQNQEVTFNDGTKKMKGGFVIMRDGDYPKPVAFELFGEERLTMLNGLNLGMPVRVSFYAESRESKDGRYYSTLRCTNIIHMMPSSNATPAGREAEPGNTPSANSWNSNGNLIQTQKHQPTTSSQNNDNPWSDDHVPV